MTATETVKDNSNEASAAVEKIKDESQSVSAEKNSAADADADDTPMTISQLKKFYGIKKCSVKLKNVKHSKYRKVYKAAYYAHKDYVRFKKLHPNAFSTRPDDHAAKSKKSELDSEKKKAKSKWDEELTKLGSFK